ncbi:hypothetical protein QBC43DRAFT_307052 [Cladorrhinum sp. PSN259]|nr:hypothetical protein QBC43DRAFT_307052 [Cladorrhinum sp. PSN259]
MGKQEKTKIKKPASSIRVLDEDGDLLLRVGSAEGTNGEQQDFKVCAAALRRSSPVFKAMLFGPWAEAKPADDDGVSEWIVALPEDEPESLEILLHLLHGKFDLPNVLHKIDMTAELLYGIFVVADKYDLTRLIGPWAIKWSESVKLVRAIDTVYMTHVFWEMGDEGRFSSSINLLSNSCRVNETGQLFYGTYTCTLDPRTLNAKLTYQLEDEEVISDWTNLGPPDLLEVIANMRLTGIQLPIAVFDVEIIQRTVQSNICNCLDGTLCNLMVLGGLLGGLLASRGPSQLPQKASQVFDSTGGLFEQLQIIVNSLPEFPAGNHCESCLPGPRLNQFRDKLFLAGVGRFYPFHLISEWKTTMAEKRERLGL